MYRSKRYPHALTGINKIFSQSEKYVPRTSSRKRQEADVIPAPTGVLDRRTLLAACAAAGALP